MNDQKILLTIEEIKDIVNSFTDIEIKIIDIIEELEHRGKL